MEPKQPIVTEPIKRDDDSDMDIAILDVNIDKKRIDIQLNETRADLLVLELWITAEEAIKALEELGCVVIKPIKH